MLKRLSNLADDQLRYYLARVQEIAALGDEAALIETDKLVWELRGEDRLASASDGELFLPDTIDDGETAYEPRWQRERAKSAVQSLASDIEKGKRLLERGPRPEGLWYVRVLRERADALGTDWTDAVTADIKTAAHQVREAAYALADELAISVHEAAIESSLTRPMVNSAITQLIIRDLVSAEAFLSEHGRLSEHWQRQIRAARERAAWYRAKKKLAEAEIADGGGKQQRASSLRGEAAVMLAQDWTWAFPGEEPPTLRSNNNE